MQQIKRLFEYMGKWKWKYLICMLSVLVTASIMEIVHSYMYKSVFHAVEYQDFKQFKMAMLMCGAFVICRYFQPYLSYFTMKQVRMLVFDIRIAMFEKLTFLNMQYFEEHHSGDVIKRLNVDANNIKDTCFSRVYRLFVLIFKGVAAVVTMLIYSPRLALISIFFSIISVSISIKINQRIKNMSIEIAENVSRLTQRLVDVISGFLVIKMYRGGQLAIGAYEEENRSVRTSMEKRTSVMSSLEMILFLIGMLGNFGTIIVGIYLVTRGEMDYGTVMGIVTLQMSVSSMFQNLGVNLANFTSAVAEAQRVFDFLELDELEEKQKIRQSIQGSVETEIDEEIPQDIVLTKEDLKAGIWVSHLTFGYPNKSAILDHFNLYIKTGEHVMLTGESGCGKSSLLKLLLRFYEAQEGKIELFGHNIKEYSIKQLRNLITYVPQESYLFEGSIKDNILYGNKNADETQMKKAAQMACADEFISILPEGYNTLLVAGGKNLSGGQRQRIAIARAFLKDAPIILLDEPSSALDVESERKINLAMMQLMKDKIVIMVTHRIHSFNQFDREIKLKGKCL